MTDRCCTPLDSIQVCCTGREVQPSSAATLRRPNTKSIVHTHSQPTAHKQPSHRTYTQSFPRCGTLLPTPHQAAHRTSSLSPFTHTTQHSRQAQPQKKHRRQPHKSSCPSVTHEAQRHMAHPTEADTPARSSPANPYGTVASPHPHNTQNTDTVSSMPWH
jgi:hypothetical protein